MRGYPKWTLERAKAHVQSKTHSFLIHKDKKPVIHSNNPITFTTMYSKEYKQVIDTVKKNFPILIQD